MIRIRHHLRDSVTVCLWVELHTRNTLSFKPVSLNIQAKTDRYIHIQMLSLRFTTSQRYRKYIPSDFIKQDGPLVRQINRPIYCRWSKAHIPRTHAQTPSILWMPVHIHTYYYTTECSYTQTTNLPKNTLTYACRQFFATNSFGMPATSSIVGILEVPPLYPPLHPHSGAKIDETANSSSSIPAMSDRGMQVKGDATWWNTRVPTSKGNIFETTFKMIFSYLTQFSYGPGILINTTRKLCECIPGTNISSVIDVHVCIEGQTDYFALKRMPAHLNASLCQE